MRTRADIALLSTLLGIGSGCAHNHGLCSWTDVVSVRDGTLVAARETKPGVAVSTDDGRTWTLQEAPRCSGLIPVGQELVCWRGNLTSWPAETPTLKYAASPFTKWAPIPHAPSGVVISEVEGSAGVHYRGQVIDLEALLSGGRAATPVDPSPASSGVIVTSTGVIQVVGRTLMTPAENYDFSGIPQVAADGIDCWVVMTEPGGDILHTGCERFEPQRVAKVPNEMRGWIFLATMPGQLLMTWPTERGSTIAFVTTTGTVTLKQGPPSTVFRLRPLPTHLWTLTSHGIYRQKYGADNWTLMLESLACGDDYLSPVYY